MSSLADPQSEQVRDGQSRTLRRGWLTRDRVLVLVLMVATLLAFAACFLLIRPFLPVIAWALALAIVARPLHDYLSLRIQNQNLAAGFAVVLVSVLLIAPLLCLLYFLLEELAVVGARVRAEAENGDWLARLDSMPWFGNSLRRLGEEFDLSGAMEYLASQFGLGFPRAVAGTVGMVFQSLFVMFTLFFFFRDRTKVLKALRSLLPLSTVETDDVLHRTTDTVHATIYGSLVVAMIQGAMGGVMFWLLGVSSPLLWGVVMGLLAVIPNLGTFVVWGPTAAFLALQGDWGRALILTLWGGLAIGLIDNLLYPYLVGKRMRMHTLLVFFAILGGLSLLGPAGVILGPVIVAITMALTEIWRRRTIGGKAAEAGAS